MAKKKIKFKLLDGMKPRKLESAGKPFGLRLPLAINLPPRTSMTVRLGLSCELPVVVVGTVGRESKIFSPGTELSVDVQSLDEAVNFSAGEVVAKAFVLDCTDCELE